MLAVKIGNFGAWVLFEEHSVVSVWHNCMCFILIGSKDVILNRRICKNFAIFVC